MMNTEFVFPIDMAGFNSYLFNKNENCQSTFNGDLKYQLKYYCHEITKMKF